MTVDQSSSAAAYVNVRDAAARGEQIPEGWAVDAAGEPTVDSEAALEGAMLPFGGYKGANIAWMVELLAGMSGANWSIDAPSFDSGSEHPGVGMFILALDASKLQNDFVARADAHVVRLSTLGVRLQEHHECCRSQRFRYARMCLTSSARVPAVPFSHRRGGDSTQPTQFTEEAVDLGQSTSLVRHRRSCPTGRCVPRGQRDPAKFLRR